MDDSLFQMPQFVLGGTPSVVHGGGAEVLPGLYPYDKCPEQPPRYFPLPSMPFDYAADDPPPPPPPPLAALSDPALAAVFALPALPALDPTAPLPPVPSTGLPLYSASGFDMLRILAKVATRPNPKIVLGPVDMTCSFVVVDVRRFDAPIVYASPTFSRLTGYPEADVLGRNCRFLQAPDGIVARGEPRRFTAPDAVRHLHKALLQEKECQASLLNYRKGGAAFINLVTVIPVAADDASDDITHHVGFQVDLAEQPSAILQRLRDGSYMVNYASPAAPGAGLFARRPRGVSQDMAAILRAAAPPPPPRDDPAKPPRDHERAALHALLLAHTDDFIHVASLKGALLYVAPAVTRVLGYAPAELIGASLADLCHPADVVPLMRELKDAAAPPAPAPPAAPAPAPPKPIHLLFRARHKAAGFVWLEARGRLHAEPGKARKAVVLVARRTAGVPALRRCAGAAGGAWGLAAPNGLVLSGARAGSSIAALVPPRDAHAALAALAAAACAPPAAAAAAGVRRVRCAGGAEVRFFVPAAQPAPRVVFQLLRAGEARGDDDAGEGEGEDVLAELAMARATSWQYELTRLRFENARMRAEVAALEQGAARGGGGGAKRARGA